MSNSREAAFNCGMCGKACLITNEVEKYARVRCDFCTMIRQEMDEGEKERLADISDNSIEEYNEQEYKRS